MQRLQGVKAKDIAKYTLLPGIIPRINEFINSGFGWLALTMAVVYNGVRLLPNGHPYLNPHNMGKFGIRHVIAEAANNLVIKKENIDQIIIFFALLLGFLLLVLQFAAIALGFIIKPAAAGGLAAFAGLFTTANPTNDIAFMILDKVFALPDMYNSKFAPAGGLGSIPPFNRGLQELFQYYSYAILVVGVFVFLYYVVVLVGETANTGTPFGRRFNHIYAPLRLVVAIGLLIPLNYGYNGGQYITLISARLGSGFATNGWIIFNNELDPGETPIGTRKETLIARPNVPDITHIVSFLSIVKTCLHSYRLSYTRPPQLRDVRAWLINSDPNAPQGPVLEMPNDYATALAFFGNQDITIRFGHQFPAGSTEENYTGNVEPTCGEITVHTNVAGTATGGPPADQRIGPYRIQEALYRLTNFAWVNPSIDEFGQRMTALHAISPPEACAVGLGLPGDCNLPPDAEWKTERSTVFRGILEAWMVGAYNEMIQVADNLYDIPDELLERGWGGAAIWYNRIAEWNGGLFTASINTPTPGRMPDVSEKVQEERRAHNESVDSENRYCPTVEGHRPIDFTNKYELEISLAICEAYKYWQTDGRGQATDMQTSGNVFFDLLNAVFGIGGLFTMRTNDDVHPLAQLSALGKSIIESSIRNLMTALVFSAGGGMGEIVGTPHLGAALQSISSMFVSFTSIGLAIGFILYYVLPFMPFIYFFFAVGGWVKTIFEAMVGVPLWALAHLRVDGNGFPGESASNGYFLIFEIFVRPILTVFGLVAAMGIFTAMARTLNGVFDLVIENLTGFDCSDCDAGTVAGLEYKRNAIDEFFFTIIYTILVYMIATSSFKLIDQIPNSILRWMGAGVQSFSDQADDPAQGLTQYAAFGGARMAGEISGALNQGARAVGQGVGLPFGLAMRNARGDVRAAGDTGGSSGGGGASLAGRTTPD